MQLRPQPVPGTGTGSDLASRPCRLGPPTGRGAAEDSKPDGTRVRDHGRADAANSRRVDQGVQGDGALRGDPERGQKKQKN